MIAKFYISFSVIMVCLFATYGVLKYLFTSKKFEERFSQEKRDKFNNIINKILKVSVICYCVLMFLCIFLPDAFALCYGKEELLLTSKEVGFAIIRWFSALAFIMLPLAVFFKNRSIRNIAIYFCSIMTIVSIIFYPTFIEYYTSTAGRGLNSISVFSENFKNFLINPTFRSIILGIQWGLELFIIVVLAVQEKHIFNFKDKKEYLYFFAILIPTLIASIPIYVPQHLFGYTDLIFDAWSVPHILWIVLTIGIVVSLYFIFRNKPREDKKLLCFILSLALIMQYNQMFSAISINVKRLPFQLCNIGSFLILFSLITENKHLFNFTVIVNVVGVLFALAVPDLDGKGLFYLYNMHFIFEHTNVLVIPVLALLFNIFPRLDKSALKDCVIGFSIYFVCVLFLGTMFNSIAASTGNDFYSANYLFMFDKAAAVDLVEPLGALFNTELHIGKFVTFYPVIQILVYIVFLTLCILMYLLIRLIYLIKDKIYKNKKDKDNKDDLTKEDKPQEENKAETTV